LALKKILGNHVQQKGSLVSAERTRFDFSHPNILNDSQIRKIEEIVNDEILKNSQTKANLMEYSDALESGAVALFGEKYSNQVRVLTIGDSKELCGGTHVNRTGDIGFFKILHETGVSSGVRRVEAITGKKAFDYVQDTDKLIQKVSSIVKTPVDKLCGKISNLLESNKKLEQQADFIQQKWISSIRDSLIKETSNFNEIRFIAKNIEQVDIKALRNLVDYVKSKIPSVIVVLSTIENEKIHLIVGVSKDLSKKYRASSIVSKLAPKIGGKGGGREDLAQAGGTDILGLHKAIKNVEVTLQELYGGKNNE
jgi:alanyl-tRNA synthetase